MKKKEVLTIFVLAVLVTGGSWVVMSPLALRGQRGFPLPFFDKHCVEAYPTGYSCSERFIAAGFFLDLLFWFLVIFGGWWVVKWVKRGKYESS